MRGHRLTITAIVALLTMPALVPAAALAGPLLSGYGGPGQGNQAILGSGLVGGRGGGSGGHGSSPSAAGGVGREGSVGSAAAGAGTGGTNGANSSGGTATTKGRHPQAAGSTPAAVRSRPGERPPGLAGAAATSAAAGGGGAFGLSGADVLYILLALGALVATGALTRVLARQPG
ncbi:MAG TPA: hypothetical protein VK721_10210 [Solirubrobacteraceae bacterium]|jgi:hypothetical protein|nr:hypothetical protein [Solirubrobacteraceae bacterium]